MLLSADSLTIIFVKIYCHWTRTVGVIAKGSRGPVFLRHSVYMVYVYTTIRSYSSIAVITVNQLLLLTTGLSRNLSIHECETTCQTTWHLLSRYPASTSGSELIFPPKSFSDYPLNCPPTNLSLVYLAMDCIYYCQFTPMTPTWLDWSNELHHRCEQNCQFNSAVSGSRVASSSRV